MRKHSHLQVEVHCPGLGSWAIAVRCRRLPFFRREPFYRCSACGAIVPRAEHTVLRATSAPQTGEVSSRVQ
jgi:hypothetical protein